MIWKKKMNRTVIAIFIFAMLISYSYGFSEAGISYDVKVGDNNVAYDNSFGGIPFSSYFIINFADTTNTMQNILLNTDSVVSYNPGDFTDNNVVVGKIILSNYVADYSDIGITCKLFDIDGNICRLDRTFLDCNGNFVIGNISLGNYTFSLTSPMSLTKSLVVSVNNNLTNIGEIILLPGDLDGDNEITSTDLSIIGLNLGLVGE